MEVRGRSTASQHQRLDHFQSFICLKGSIQKVFKNKKPHNTQGAVGLIFCGGAGSWTPVREGKPSSIYMLSCWLGFGWSNAQQQSNFTLFCIKFSSHAADMRFGKVYLSRRSKTEPIDGHPWERTAALRSQSVWVIVVNYFLSMMNFLRDSSDKLGMQPVIVRNPSNPVHPQYGKEHRAD